MTNSDSIEPISFLAYWYFKNKLLNRRSCPLLMTIVYCIYFAILFSKILLPLWKTVIFSHMEIFLPILFHFYINYGFKPSGDFMSLKMIWNARAYKHRHFFWMNKWIYFLFAYLFIYLFIYYALLSDKFVQGVFLGSKETVTTLSHRSKTVHFIDLV